MNEIIQGFLPYAPYALSFWMGGVLLWLFAPVFDIEIKFKTK